MSSLRIALGALALVSLFAARCDRPASESSASLQGAFVGGAGEEYYMVTFVSGIEYWKGCYRGFQEAGKLLGIKTIYTGAPQYDVNQEVTVLEQVIAKNPAGIAVTCINPDALVGPIRKAMDAGIPVVTFDADAPRSGRYSFLATGNEYAGSVAAGALAGLIGGKGEVIVLTLPAQLNHEQRTAGFRKALQADYPGIKLVAVGNGKADQTEAAKVLAAYLQAHPNVTGVFCTDATSGVGAATAVKEAGKAGAIKIVSFDTDKATLDAIREGVIAASISQGTYAMGYWSMQFLFQVRHGLVKPVEGWKEKGISPLPPYMDTGVHVVTKENVDAF